MKPPKALYIEVQSVLYNSKCYKSVSNFEIIGTKSHNYMWWYYRIYYYFKNTIIIINIIIIIVIIIIIIIIIIILSWKLPHLVLTSLILRQNSLWSICNNNNNNKTLED